MSPNNSFVTPTPLKCLFLSPSVGSSPTTTDFSLSVVPVLMLFFPLLHLFLALIVICELLRSEEALSGALRTWEGGLEPHLSMLLWNLDTTKHLKDSKDTVPKLNFDILIFV